MDVAQGFRAPPRPRSAASNQAAGSGPDGLGLSFFPTRRVCRDPSGSGKEDITHGTPFGGDRAVSGTHTRHQPRSPEGGPVSQLPMATLDRGVPSPVRGSQQGNPRSCRRGGLPERGVIVTQGLDFGLEVPGCPNVQRALPGTGSGELGKCPNLDHLVPVRSFLSKLCPRPSLVRSRPPQMPTKLPTISTEDVMPFARGHADPVRAGELSAPRPGQHPPGAERNPDSP